MSVIINNYIGGGTGPTGAPAPSAFAIIALTGTIGSGLVNMIMAHRNYRSIYCFHWNIFKYSDSWKLYDYDFQEKLIL